MSKETDQLLPAFGAAILKRTLSRARRNLLAANVRTGIEGNSCHALGSLRTPFGVFHPIDSLGRGNRGARRLNSCPG